MKQSETENFKKQVLEAFERLEKLITEQAMAISKQERTIDPFFSRRAYLDLRPF